MTALRPHPSWEVTPVDRDEERNLLRKVLTNKTCAHPDCDKPTESVHHLWPRGTVGSPAWFVQVPGVADPVLHAVGLCGSGTTGHHGDLEEHRGWVKYEDGVFNWYERGGNEKELGWLEDPDYRPLDTIDAEWVLLGPLVPQPGQVGAAKKRRKPTPDTDRRKSKFIRFRVPDDAENGAEVLDTLIQACREQFAPELGWTDEVGTYFVLTAALVKALQA